MNNGIIEPKQNTLEQELRRNICKRLSLLGLNSYPSKMNEYESLVSDINKLCKLAENRGYKLGLQTAASIINIREH